LEFLDLIGHAFPKFGHCFGHCSFFIKQKGMIIMPFKVPGMGAGSNRYNGLFKNC